MKSRIKYYFKIWVLMAKNALLGWSTSRNVFLVFLSGKTVRYVSYFGFLYFLVNGINGLLGYSPNQVLFVTITFVFVDTLSQFLFRSVYSFRGLVVSGDFDLILVKPINPLFRSLMGGPDPIDLVTIPPILILLVAVGANLHPSLFQVLFFILLIFNSLAISAAFHVFVLGVNVITLQADHLMEVFRDLSSMGRFPINIYKEPMRGILTYLVPVGIMYTFPVNALSGTLKTPAFTASLLIGVFLFIVSIKFWNYALRRYSSASS